LKGIAELADFKSNGSCQDQPRLQRQKRVRHHNLAPWALAPISGVAAFSARKSRRFIGFCWVFYARVWAGSAVSACLGGKALNGFLNPTTSHFRITDANKFFFSSHNLYQGLGCCPSIQIFFSA
jgi:hypothetical protein